MFEIGWIKIDKCGLSIIIELQQGDLENLLFLDNMFDVIIVVFGVCNFEYLEKGFEEMYWVLKLGGKFVVLEFFKFWVFLFK